MTITFERENNELLLYYEPDYGYEDILKKLKEGERTVIKRTFNVCKELLRNESYGELIFCIGEVENDYTKINLNVLGTKNSFYFSNDIELTKKMFCDYRNISILKRFDEIIERDVYIGGDWSKNNGIPEEVFYEFLKRFPTKAETDYYVKSRMASIIKEYLPECDKYQPLYDKFINKKNKPIDLLEKKEKRNIINEIEIEQFSFAYSDLEDMLLESESISEKVWQERIFDIIRLLYPKYIISQREVTFKGIDKDEKRPDFVLVDANGFVDILEIKKIKCADIK